MVSGSAMRAKIENGGSARAPIAPETKAIARRRQPQDRMTPSTSGEKALARGMTAEIGEAQGDISRGPLNLGRRIAIADHSPIATGVRINDAARRASADIQTRDWSVAPFHAIGSRPDKRRRRQT